MTFCGVSYRRWGEGGRETKVAKKGTEKRIENIIGIQEGGSKQREKKNEQSTKKIRIFVKKRKGASWEYLTSATKLYEDYRMK